jgi:hypothetical protein
MFANCHELRARAQALASDDSVRRIRAALDAICDFVMDDDDGFLDSLSDDAQASFVVSFLDIYRVLDELDPVEVVIAGHCVRGDAARYEHELPAALRTLIQGRDSVAHHVRRTPHQPESRPEADLRSNSQRPGPTP